MIKPSILVAVFSLFLFFGFENGVRISKEDCLHIYARCLRRNNPECISTEDYNHCQNNEDFVNSILELLKKNDKVSPVEGNVFQLVHFGHNENDPVNENRQPKETTLRSKYSYLDLETGPHQNNALNDDSVLATKDVYEAWKERGVDYSNMHDAMRKRRIGAKLKRHLRALDSLYGKSLKINFPLAESVENWGETTGAESVEDDDTYYVAAVANALEESLKRNTEGKKRQGEVSNKFVPGDDYNHISEHIDNGQPSFQLANERSKEELLKTKNHQTKKLYGKRSQYFDVRRTSTAQTGPKFESEPPSVKKGKENRFTKNKKDLIFVEVAGDDKINVIAKSEYRADADQDEGHLILHVQEKLNNTAARTFANRLQNILWGIKVADHNIFPQLSNKNRILTLHMVTNPTWFKLNENARDVANQLNKDQALRSKLARETGVTVVSADSRGAAIYHHPVEANLADWDQFALITAIVGGCTLAIIVTAVVICCIKRRRGKGSFVALKKQEAVSDYQELLRTQMSINASEPARNMKATFDQQRHGLVNGQGKVMRRTWGDEPQRYNMDISTGHVVLAYMEDHLKNEDRLNKEWEVLCQYEADPKETNIGREQGNARKNRYADVLPFDHSRVKLKETTNLLHTDYINANFITDVDPHNPAYIATQGPLENTIADFWQMIWEQGVVVIVNLTRLSDMGMSQCYRYWPEDGSEVHHIYEIHLISEHIWCDDYLVRSFYLKNIQTSETRTVTQFHFLTWPDLSVPDSPKALLEFRRKVNKCYRGQACPIIVHCNDGVGRTGTYILVDLVLNSMMKGAKEIDIAATLEHLRDQRPDMVKAKAQFEFALAAVAEEVTAILTSLPS